MLFLKSVPLLLRRHGVDSGGWRRFLSDGRRYRKLRSIGTLDRSRLLPSDCVKISGVCRPKISTANSFFDLFYHADPNSGSNRLVFPADSRGFLYLSNAEEPRSAWQMRFRVTSSDSPEEFNSGTDLLLPNQKPWIMALKTLGTKQLAAVREILVKDGFLSDTLPAIRPRALKQSVQTLVSARLRPSDYLDLAGTAHPHISTQNSKFQLLYTKGERLPFPPSARGFLYLHAPAAEPQVTWQIRFRVTEHDSPTSFESGSDLLYPNQTPWFVSLVAIKSDRGPLFTLRELLVRDGFDVDRLAERSTNQSGPLSKPLIHSLGQLFHVDFQHYILDVAFVGFGADSKVERTMGSPLSIRLWSKERSTRHRPYAGSALCCFEAHSSSGSTYPDTLALRIKKMTTPVTTIEPEFAYRIPMPQEGELVMRYTRRGPDSVVKTLDPRPWTLDTPTTAHPVVQAILLGKTVR